MRAVIASLVRVKFAATGGKAAAAIIREQRNQYLTLAGRIDDVSGSRPVRVPKMPGVDEDMREWSFFMILEHNAIVNRQFTAIIRSLVTGCESPQLDGFDPKRDVMPDQSAGFNQIEAFAHSVKEHLDEISEYTGLRSTRTREHPLFGEFNAHYWHCMFGFHLKIHYNQARHVVNSVAPL